MKEVTRDTREERRKCVKPPRGITVEEDPSSTKAARHVAPGLGTVKELITRRLTTRVKIISINTSNINVHRTPRVLTGWAQFATL